jgi:hypothetical protein
VRACMHACMHACMRVCMRVPLCVLSFCLFLLAVLHMHARLCACLYLCLPSTEAVPTAFNTYQSSPSTVQVGIPWALLRHRTYRCIWSILFPCHCFIPRSLAVRPSAFFRRSAYREPSFGHGILVVENATHAVWEWHRNQDAADVVSDRTLIVRDGKCVGRAGVLDYPLLSEDVPSEIRVLDAKGDVLFSGGDLAPTGGVGRGDIAPNPPGDAVLAPNPPARGFPSAPNPPMDASLPPSSPVGGFQFAADLMQDVRGAPSVAMAGDRAPAPVLHVRMPPVEGSE